MQNKYFVSIVQPKEFTAANKARDDVDTILEKNGFKKIMFDPIMPRVKKLLVGSRMWKEALKNMIAGEIVFQFPFPSRLLLKQFFSSISNKPDLKTIALAHDIDSLRFFINDPSRQKEEIEELNSFDVIIAHNAAMKSYLISAGVTKPIVELELFDYLSSCKILDRSQTVHEICYAGNLQKAPFFSEYTGKVPIQIFGPNPLPKYPPSVHYNGSYPPSELASKLNGIFGLVWDGNSIQGGGGLYGSYTRYNNPHKASLFLSLGIPIIVWNNSALSRIVETESLGVSIKSLDDIDSTISNLSEDDYFKMKLNAEKMSKKVRHGYFTLKAIRESEDLLR